MPSVWQRRFVLPYTKAKERYFPAPDPGETEIDILKQIRDSIAVR